MSASFFTSGDELPEAIACASLLRNDRAGMWHLGDFGVDVRHLSKATAKLGDILQRW